MAIDLLLWVHKRNVSHSHIAWLSVRLPVLHEQKYRREKMEFLKPAMHNAETLVQTNNLMTDENLAVTAVFACSHNTLSPRVSRKLKEKTLTTMINTTTSIVIVFQL